MEFLYCQIKLLEKHKYLAPPCEVNMYYKACPSRKSVNISKALLEKVNLNRSYLFK